MKLTIESTDRIMKLDGVPVRVWEGTTPAGEPVFVFVHRVAVRIDADVSQFDESLIEQTEPVDIEGDMHGS